MALLFPVLILVLMWVFLIRPQQRRVKEHAAFVASLEVGDEVITTAGLYGTIAGLTEETAELVIAPGVTVTVARLAVARPQGATGDGDGADADEHAGSVDPTDSETSE